MAPEGALVAFLLGVTSGLSGLPIPPKTPVPLVESAASAWGTKLARDEGSVVAVTNMLTGQIVLPADWKPEKGDICILVHELAHYLQFVNRVPHESIAELEPLAYGTEAKCYDLREERERAAWAREMVTTFQEALAASH